MSSKSSKGGVGSAGPRPDRDAEKLADLTVRRDRGAHLVTRGRDGVQWIRYANSGPGRPSVYRIVNRGRYHNPFERRAAEEDTRLVSLAVAAYEAER